MTYLKSYPIGIQTFSRIIREGYIYVDITEQELVTTLSEDFNTDITRIDGYLTIKDYDHETMIYSLSIPNREVRIGYTEGLLPTYILELKTRGSAKEALAQITDKNHTIPFQSEGRKVVKAGLPFDIESQTLKECRISQSF